MSVLHAVVLGVVQGLTEFLPVSSSGHLDLVPWLLGWNDFAGRRGPDLDKAFDVALHLGTFVGVVAYFASDLLRYLRAGVRSLAGRGEGDPDGRLAWLLVLSSLPAAATGALLESFIEEHLSEEALIGVLLVVFGLVLWAADRLPATRDDEGFRFGDALAMGTAQALALAPGVSRSGVTISAGRALGFTGAAAARLSFLMSIPIIGGAGLYKGVDVMAGGGIPPGFGAAFATGTVTAAVTGWLAVWWMLRLMRTRSFTPFVVYRVVVGLAVVGIAAAGWR